MDLRLLGKVALVTGGSRGIGRAIALGLAAEGCAIAACARGSESLLRLEKELVAMQAPAMTSVVDVSSSSDLDRFVQETAERFGRIDVVVANAGGAISAPVEKATDAEWQDGLDRNVLHAARLARAAIPELRKTQGRILIVSSIWGREAGGSPIYNASKAAEISLAKSLSTELGPVGIAVNAICPGSTLFPGGSWARRVEADPQKMADFVSREIPSGRFGSVDEVADVAVFLCSPRARWVTGTTVVVDGGQSRSNL
jgi:3-oxoacyl-[acyl-carrier protein] reductase